MKKATMIILTAAMVMAMLCGCQEAGIDPAKAESVIEEVKEQISETDPHVPGPAGGWAVPIPDEISDEALEAFNKATETMTGLTCEPMVLLGCQIVAGTNYCFLCKASASYEDMPTGWAFVYIYQDLDGNAEIQSVQIVEPGYLANVEKADFNDIRVDEIVDSTRSMGAWSYTEPDEHDIEVFEKLDSGMDLMFKMEEQLVAGTNYCFLAKQDGVRYFVYVYEDLDGNVSLSGKVPIDIGAFMVYGDPEGN